MSEYKSPSYVEPLQSIEAKPAASSAAKTGTMPNGAVVATLPDLLTPPEVELPDVEVDELADDVFELVSLT